MNKICTSIEQSKKLIELGIDVNTADMHWQYIEEDNGQLQWFYGTRGYTHVRFRYGYTKRTMLFELKGITIGKGKTEWGAPEDKEVFIIKHH